MQLHIVIIAKGRVINMNMRYLFIEGCINPLFDGAIASAAIFFVAIFAQLRLNEQQAREHAEQLLAKLEQANVQLAAYATQAEELA